VVKPLLNKALKETSLNLCKDIAGHREVVAACFYGPRVCGYADEKSDVNILLVLSDGRPALKGHLKPLNEINAFILAADQGMFEKDVEQGRLGEFIAEKIATPHEPLINEEYLRLQEAKLKMRLIWEILENIVSESPELSHELLIEAEYFLYEAMARRARLFPPITYGFLNMLRENLRDKNLNAMMKGYLEALNKLAEDDWIIFSDGHVKVTKSFVEAVRRRKLPVPIFIRSIQRAVSLHVLSVFPKMMRPLIHDQKLFMESHREAKAEELIFQLEDPKKHLFIPTPLGLVRLSDRTTIEDFLGKAVPDGEMLDLKMEEVGGVLNTVYLLTFQKGQKEQKVIVKEFKDWRGFKWFPLALWALGTRSFAVLGRSRLEREYAINQFLRSRGLPVPRVLYVSPKGRLIFEEFIEGENLVQTIKRVISDKQVTPEEASLIREVGRKIAEAHKLGVALGDCKPENVIITKEGKNYFVDFEQAARNGNQAWDIAEFLYYSGHYVSPLSSGKTAELVAREFIKGYLEAGGAEETVRKAGSIRYTKVFSIFTPPHVLLAISKVCKKMGRK